MQKFTEEKNEQVNPKSENKTANKDEIEKKFSKTFSASSLKNKIGARKNIETKAQKTEQSSGGVTAAEASSVEELNRNKQTVIKLKNQLARLASDYEVIRNNKEKEVSESKDFAISQFAKDLIQPFENLLRIHDNIKSKDADKDNDPMLNSVEVTLREFLKAFEKNNLVRIYPLGEKFNHDFHEAVSMIQSADKDPGTVIEVLQAGYTLNKRLIKPATVIIATQNA